MMDVECLGVDANIKSRPILKHLVCGCMSKEYHYSETLSRGNTTKKVIALNVVVSMSVCYRTGKEKRDTYRKTEPKKQAGLTGNGILVAMILRYMSYRN